MSIRSEIVETLLYDLEFRRGVNLFTQPQVSAGKQGGQFDIARTKQGQTTLTNTWAFNLKSLAQTEKDGQAANWIISRIRKGGATLTAGERHVQELPRDAHIEAVYDPPKRGRGDRERMRVFEAVSDGWADNGVVAVEIETFLHDAERIAQVETPELADLL